MAPDEFDEFEDIHTPEGRAALIERLDRERAESEADIERRRAERLATPADPDWTRFDGSVAGMTTAEFDLWCVRGKPSLVRAPSPPPPPQPEPRPDAVTKAALDREVMAVIKAAVVLDEDLEKKVEKRIGDELDRMQQSFNASVKEHALAQIARAADLREEREAAQTPIWQHLNQIDRRSSQQDREILKLQRELLDLRQMMAAGPELRSGGRAVAVRTTGNGYDHDG